MLQQARPLADADRYIVLDSSTEVFIVTDPNGKVLIANCPPLDLGPNAKTTELLRIAFRLFDYPELKPADRPALATKVEKEANALLKRASGPR